MIEKLNDIIEPAISDLGFELVKLEFKSQKAAGAIGKSPAAPKGLRVLEILIDHSQRPITFADCREVSNCVSGLLDVKVDIKDKYFLEVSSCGVERPLVRLQDYTRFIGRLVKIRLLPGVRERLNFRATIKAVEGDNILLMEHGQKSGQKKAEEQELTISFAEIKSSRLVLTDELFRNMLKKQK